MTAPRILVVDDDVAITRVLKRTFDRAGFETLTVDNGAQAFALIAHEHFDAMICDLQMPHMNGRELCRRLAGDAVAFPTCVFIVTSRPEADEREWVREFPGITLIEKPIGPKQLLLRVCQRLRAEASEDGETERSAA
jgi:DNA-binding response OmpR family regulator